MHSGDVMELNDESAEITGKVHTGAILVDGLGVVMWEISYFVTVSIWQKTVL